MDDEQWVLSGAADDDDANLQISDLRHAGGAHHVPALWSADGLAGRRPTRGRWLWRLGTAAGIAAVIAAVLLVTLRGSLHLFEHVPVPPYTLRPPQEGLGCVNDAAWSPDGARIAVLAHPGRPCSSSAYAAASVLIYDGQSGALEARVDLARAVLPALQALPASAPMPQSAQSARDGPLITFPSVTWSPDGQRLALPFLTVFAQPQAAASFAQGLLMLARDGTHPRTLLHPGVPGQMLAAEWDLASGKAVASSTVPDFSLPDPAGPIVSFHWEAGGILKPDASSPSGRASGAAAPVGSPEGGRSFTIWQPGVLSPLSSEVADVRPNQQQQPYAWSALVAAWSPDGRYLVPALHLYGPLQSIEEAPGETSFNASGAMLRPVPVRDAALKQLLSWTATPTTSGWNVAWRPDGRVLASFGPRDLLGRSVELYDCASGRKLASLEPIQGVVTILDNVADYGKLLWSPDGSHLLHYTPWTGSVTIWGPDQLPR
jgi:WD40 repeat protein